MPERQKNKSQTGQVSDTMSEPTETTLREAINSLLERKREIMRKFAELQAEDQDLDTAMRVIKRYRVGTPEEQTLDGTTRNPPVTP